MNMTFASIIKVHCNNFYKIFCGVTSIEGVGNKKLTILDVFLAYLDAWIFLGVIDLIGRQTLKVWLKFPGYPGKVVPSTDFGCWFFNKILAFFELFILAQAFFTLLKLRHLFLYE